MKKNILLFFIFLFSMSCISKVEKTIQINNLKTIYIDSLVPNEKMIKKGYITYSVKISGFSNDTIILNINKREKKSNIYLTGKFDKRYTEEYLGKSSKNIFINPYNSTKNNISIKYGLYK